MTLSDFERRIQSCNPRLYIKRYGTSKAGVHCGSRFVCRIPQGEITPFNVFVNEWGQSGNYASGFNPKGYYKFRRLLKRGRLEAARILYTSGLITFDDISKIAAI